MKQFSGLPIGLYEIYLDDETESLMVVSNRHTVLTDLFNSTDRGGMHRETWEKLLNYGKVRRIRSFDKFPVSWARFEPLADLDNYTYSYLWGVTCENLCSMMDQKGNIVLPLEKIK